MNEETVAVLKNAPVKAVKPSGEEIEIAPLVQAPETSVAQIEPREVAPSEIALTPKQPVVAVRVKRLPQTASQIPLLALIGLLSIGTGIGLSIIAKRTV